MNAPVPPEAGNSNNVQTPEATKEREKKAPQARNNRPQRPKGNPSSEVPQVSATAGNAAQAKTGQEPRPSRNNRKISAGTITVTMKENVRNVIQIQMFRLKNG